MFRKESFYSKFYKTILNTCYYSEYQWWSKQIVLNLNEGKEE